jgi:hypothetical protein
MELYVPLNQGHRHAPSPEAIRQVAQKSTLPVNEIVEVRVLDPHFYH